LDNSQVQKIGLVKCSAWVRGDGKGDLPQYNMEIIMESYKESKEASKAEERGKKDPMEKEGKLLSEVGKGISMPQMIPETRHNERLQDQLVRNIWRKSNEESKKRSLEGMELPINNSFSILSNDKISAIPADMGVKISLDNLDIVDIMKDLEMARLALDTVKCVKPHVPIIEEYPVNEVEASDVPLLEWLDDDSEVEQFILVQSSKKRRDLS
jgi:hypothetical protein